MKSIALDCEHSFGVMYPWEEGFYLTNVGLIRSTGEESVVWFDHCEMHSAPDGFDIIQSSINWAEVIVGHNLKHDMDILRYYEVNFEGKILHCTQLTDYLLTGQNTHELKFDLNSVAARYGLPGKDDRVRTYWDTGIETYDIPANLLGPYVLQDCRIPMLLRSLQLKAADDAGMRKLVNLQNEYQFTLSDMEVNGFVFSIKRAKEIVQEHAEKAKPLVEQFKELVGESRLNVGSNSQLSAVLYGGALKTTWKEWTIKTHKTVPESKYWEKTYKEEKQVQGLRFAPLPRTKRKDGYFKTDKETIAQLRAKNKPQRLAKRLLIEHSAIAKVIETLQGKKKDKGLLNRIRSDGKIHPKLNHTVARTGRLTSPEQQWPRTGTSPIRECIIPDNDGIMEIDLSQIEWRCAGELSEDWTMINEVNSGVDQHNTSCTDIMKLELSSENRQEAKVFNFRYVYGGSVWGYHLDPNMPSFSLKRWQQILKIANDKYFGLIAWQNRNINRVWVHKGDLQIKTGRKFKFHKIVDKHGDEGYNENQIKNYPVQGIAGGDCFPLLAVVFRRGMMANQLKSKLILTLHDCLVIDYIESELQILVQLGYGIANSLHSYMKNYYGIEWHMNLAGEIKIGPNYGQLKEV